MPGHRPATLRDVAALAAVSVSTVSNFLNRPEVLAEATAVRVRSAISELGFVHNRSAARLRGADSRLVGVVVTDVGNPFWGNVVRGVEEVIAEHDISLVVASTYQDPRREASVLRALLEHGVDGVLVALVGADAPLEAIALRGGSVVLLDVVDPRGRWRSAAVDDELGGWLAAEHLFAAGHTAVALVNGPHSVSWCAARARGVWAAARAAQLDPARAVLEIEVGELSIEEGERAAAGLTGVSAVMCANDMVTLGVLRGLTGRGVVVPDHISLVGYDDPEFAVALNPALTTVRQPPRELGRAAAELLMGTRPDSVVFSPQLVVRASVGPPGELLRF